MTVYERLFALLFALKLIMQSIWKQKHVKAFLLTGTKDIVKLDNENLVK